MNGRSPLLVGIIVGTLGTLGLVQAAPAPGSSSWVSDEADRALTLLLNNVSPPGTARGVVVASPSRENPDYYYHWVRDSSIVMDALVTLYRTSPKVHSRGLYYADLMDFAGFSRQNQLTSNPSGPAGQGGLGEPKFNVDGTAFTQPWGRPQNDGPALRALALTHFAQILLDEGNEAIVRQKLYDSPLPAQTVIKADLEYVAQHWRDESFDLWEEVRGMHLYTAAAQRRALLAGAGLAERLGDGGAATYYREQASLLQREIERHWDASRGYYVETLERMGGQMSTLVNHASGLDSGVILTALHDCAGDGVLCASDEKILATASHLEQAFRNLYPINAVARDSQGEILGTGIGRYPEDIYDGYGTSAGNPWFILTNAFAELSYRAASEFEASGKLAVTPLNLSFLLRSLELGADAGPVPALQAGLTLTRGDSRFEPVIRALRGSGDAYMRRSRYHMDAQGSFAEEFNRDIGYMTGARDLSWSYESFLTAAWASQH